TKLIQELFQRAFDPIIFLFTLIFWRIFSAKEFWVSFEFTVKMDLRPRKRQIQSITGFTQAESLESKGFRFSRTKIEYLKCKFSDVTHAAEVGMKIDAQVIPKRESFKYLASIIQGDGEIEDDVAHRIGVGWVKWRLLCDKNVSPRVKSKFYKMVIRSTLLYELECRKDENLKTIGRQLLQKVEKMENLLIESREQVCDSEVCKKLAKTFTRSKGRAGKSIAKWTEVQAWFQNRLVCYPSKDTSAEANQKLPDYTEGCTLNKANESSHIPKGQKDPALSDLEFEARSSKDGSWYVYRVVVRPSMFECCGMLAGEELASTKDESNGNEDVEIDVWHTRRDMIRNKDIWDKVGVGPMVDKIREARLRWFGHVKRIQYDIDTFIAHRFLNSEEPEALVRFVGFGLGEDEWVNVRKAVRERSVALENSECNKVQVGDIILCFQEGKDEEKYLEAQVIEIQKKLHDIRGCRCLFVIRYTGDDTEETIRLRRMCVRPSILGRP
ncbi:hypothetical protein H5410_058424, partial [Solanum commersonii]